MGFGPVCVTLLYVACECDTGELAARQGLPTVRIIIRPTIRRCIEAGVIHSQSVIKGKRYR